jgi:hypothetical protein
MRRHRVFIVICVLALALGAGNAIRHGLSAGHIQTANESPSKDAATPPAQVLRKKDWAPHSQSPHRRVASNSSVPLPPPGTPLKDIYAELKARADAGDVAAAARLAHDLGKCQYIAHIKQTLPQIMPFVLDQDDKKLTADELSRRDKTLDFYQKQFDMVRGNAAFCAGLDRSDFETLTPVLKRAAQLGSTTATDCYLSSGLTDMEGLLDHPEWLVEFKQNAMPLAQAAIENGDWVTVGIMEHAYGGLFNDFLSQITGTDLAQRYRYLKLQRLGASGDFIAKLDKQISGITQNLTAGQIADGDNWALDTYAHYFNGSSSNELSNGTNVCQISDN